MMRLCTEQMAKVTYTNFLKKVPVCGKSDILIQLSPPHPLPPAAYLSNYFETFET